MIRVYGDHGLAVAREDFHDVFVDVDAQLYVLARRQVGDREWCLGSADAQSAGLGAEYDG